MIHPNWLPRCVALNDETVVQLFAQVWFIYMHRHMTRATRIRSLGKTGLSPSRDVCGARVYDVVTTFNVCAVPPRVNFVYNHCISTPVAELADDFNGTEIRCRPPVLKVVINQPSPNDWAGQKCHLLFKRMGVHMRGETTLGLTMSFPSVGYGMLCDWLEAP